MLGIDKLWQIALQWSARIDEYAYHHFKQRKRLGRVVEFCVSGASMRSAFFVLKKVGEAEKWSPIARAHLVR